MYQNEPNVEKRTQSDRSRCDDTRYWTKNDVLHPDGVTRASGERLRSRRVRRSIMLNRVLRGIAGGRTNVFPVDGEEDHSSSLDVCSRQRSPQEGGNL